MTAEAEPTRIAVEEYVAGILRGAPAPSREQVEAVRSAFRPRRQTSTDDPRCDVQPGIEYLTALPDAVPAGRVLVHNSVRPTRRLASRGFRAWLSPPTADRLEVCGCAWASELGQHFRVVHRRAVTAAIVSTSDAGGRND